MNDNMRIRTFSLPMRWLALAAAFELSLVVLAATGVQSEPLNPAPIVAGESAFVSYARAVSQAIVRTETAVLPLNDL